MFVNGKIFIWLKTFLSYYFPQVLVTYQMGYRYDFTQPGHDKCTPEAQYYGTELETNGKLICEG